MQINLSDSNSHEVWLAFLCGLLIIEAFLLLTFRLFPNFWGDTINLWYDQFGIIAIMLDILIVLIGFWITQWLYGKLFDNSNNKFQLWKFILLFLIVQIIHDFSFYFLIIKRSKGSNSVIDLMKKYGNKHGALTVVGDSIMVVLALLATYGLLTMNTSFGSYIISLLVSVYLICYLLYQRWQ